MCGLYQKQSIIKGVGIFRLIFRSLTKSGLETSVIDEFVAGGLQGLTLYSPYLAI